LELLAECRDTQQQAKQLLHLSLATWAPSESCYQGYGAEGERSFEDGTTTMFSVFRGFLAV
jgi:hypothetical protein